MDSKRLTAVVSAFNLSEEIALAIWKIHVEAAPGLLKRYGLELSNRYDGEEEEENENRMFRDVMRSALKRDISYLKLSRIKNSMLTSWRN